MAPIHLVLFSVFISLFVLFLSVCPAAWKSALVIPAIAHCKSAWEFGGIAASPRAASPHARRSREISAAGCGYSKPTTDSMPAGSPLTQAHRIGADSCPLAAANPSPVDPVHKTARSTVCMSCRAHRNILTILSVMSTETRLEFFFFWGGGGSMSSGCRGRAEGTEAKAPKTICHGLQSSQLHHGLLSSLHRHGFQSSQLRHGPSLSVPLWRSPSCVPVRVCPEGPPERPPPLPDGTVKARDEPSRLLCPYLVCFLSLFNVIISSFMSSRVCLIIYDLPLYLYSPVCSV